MNRFKITAVSMAIAAFSVAGAAHADSSETKRGDSAAPPAISAPPAGTTGTNSGMGGNATGSNPGSMSSGAMGSGTMGSDPANNAGDGSAATKPETKDSMTNGPSGDSSGGAGGGAGSGGNGAGGAGGAGGAR